MRRLRKKPCREDGERGGISVIVAIIMVALLGFTALAIDVGMLYSERTQLRNGSDAAALAVAQKCAKDANDPECSAISALARSLASSNAGDRLSNVQSLTLDTATHTVTVAAGAQEAGKEPNHVSLFFARALGINTTEVTAASTVQWGSPLAGPTAFPVTFSICQVQNHVDGTLQLLQNHGSNANPDCFYSPSGAPVSGGFGWLTSDPGVCGGLIDLDVAEGGSDPGNSGAPDICLAILQRWASDITAGKDVVVLLPVFDDVSGTGSGAVYGLKYFASFKVAGWKFSGNDDLPKTFRNSTAYVSSSVACDGSCRGIIGSFIEYVSLADGFTLGRVDASGATIVRLIQ
ncbi:Flp pilus assembly protein TadG [Arthrobacter sp. V4I6]|uniref:pilus assembly protein TadG-related protein n=1 Tax=unclassified Arthrobacter TaxID=235627 RepID=UPI0027878754|nr:MULTISPECIES: pilus assembly protein TadG-related protein [unclassified Arthrobacter]MDQ0820007.1 Flp pilus assembly protein TadG [Arthrobacter sp. V1I7]MDQ0854188.1 Flp pilus assembly protein TadG [Arthrobacter sp. V4I6]